jgi:hypothetical protein
MVAAVAATALFTCRPAQGLGTLTYTRSQIRRVVDLSTCRDRAIGPAPSIFTWGPFISPDGRLRALSDGKHITIRNRTSGRRRDIFSSPGAIELDGWSPDSGWVLFAVDPMSSASIAADGLTVQAVSATSRAVATLGPMLAYPDYRAWCGRSLVFTVGGNRIATADKRLVVTTSKDWHVRQLGAEPDRAWGSLACAPGARSVVVQSQRATSATDMTFPRSHWALWRVGLDGSRQRLTSPPPGWSDDSPSFVGRTLFFVRERRGAGAVYALRGGHLLGPFAEVGTDAGYYGHHTWDYSVTP